MVEPPKGSLSVEPLSDLSFGFVWGAYLVRGPKRELLVLVTYLRGATLPHPFYFISILGFYIIY